MNDILPIPLEHINFGYVIGGSTMIVSCLIIYKCNINLFGCGQYVSKWVFDLGMFYIFGILPSEYEPKDLSEKHLDIESKSNTNNVEPPPKIENQFKLANCLDQMIFELEIDKIIKEQKAFDKVVENTIGKKP